MNKYFILLIAALAVGCTDVSKFSTEPGESYCGVVTSAAFVRAGLPEGARMRLELNAERLQDAPGKLWLDALENGEKLDGAVLRGVPQLAFDPLSTLEFGEGRT